MIGDSVDARVQQPARDHGHELVGHIFDMLWACARTKCFGHGLDRDGGEWLEVFDDAFSPYQNKKRLDVTLEVYVAEPVGTILFKDSEALRVFTIYE